MKSKQTMFFATLDDIKPILKSIEELYDVQYFEMGLFDDKNIVHYKSIFEIPNIGFILKGDWNYDRQLMIMPENIPLFIKDIPQKKGGIKYAVNPGINATSVCLQLGGIYSEKENVLIAGKIGIVSIEEFSLEFFKVFSGMIKKSFKKNDAFYVGKDAEEKLKNGWRLVTNERMSKDYDLQIAEMK